VVDAGKPIYMVRWSRLLTEWRASVIHTALSLSLSLSLVNRTVRFMIAQYGRWIISAVWITLILWSILVLSLWRGAPNIVVRKYFHLLAVVMFLPGIYFEVRTLEQTDSCPQTTGN